MNNSWRILRKPTKNNDGRFQTSIVSKIVVENPICAVFGKTEEECYRNANLIECAPELVQELKHLVNALKIVSSFGATTSIINHAELLIKKATE